MSVSQNIIRVAAVDDESIVRMMIEKFLSNNDSIQFLGAFHDIDQMMIGMNQSPDVILLDWNLAGARVHGSEGILAIKQRFPAARIIVFSGLSDDETAIQAISTGADGYLLKNTPAHHLVSAVGSVNAGENPLSPTILTKLVRFVRNFGKSGNSLKAAKAGESAEETGLTGRERNVMDLICKGESTKKIADHMGVTIHTIRFHLRNIYEKLGAHSQTEAVLNYLKI